MILLTRKVRLYIRSSFSTNRERMSEKMVRWGGGGGGGGGGVVVVVVVVVRTQIAEHSLRADSNCFPYLQVSLRHEF